MGSVGAGVGRGEGGVRRRVWWAVEVNQISRAFWIVLGLRMGRMMRVLVAVLLRVLALGVEWGGRLISVET